MGHFQLLGPDLARADPFFASAGVDGVAASLDPRLPFLREGLLALAAPLHSAQIPRLMLKPLMGFRVLHWPQNCVIGLPILVGLCPGARIAAEEFVSHPPDPVGKPEALTSHLVRPNGR